MKKIVILILLAGSLLHAKSKDHQRLDSCDVSCGPNRYQAAPKLLNARRIGCDVLIAGSLKGAPDTEFLVLFYDAEGTTFLGQKQIKTNLEGSATFIATVPCVCICVKKSFPCTTSCCENKCSCITATATRVNNDTLGDTSEFSKSINVKNCR